MGRVLSGYVRDPREELSDPVEGWISERLLARLEHLALAYELPLLKRLPTIGVEIYPEIQVQELEDELALLFSVVSDDALLESISPLREMLRKAMYDPRGWSLKVECP